MNIQSQGNEENIKSIEEANAEIARLQGRIKNLLAEVGDLKEGKENFKNENVKLVNRIKTLEADLEYHKNHEENLNMVRKMIDAVPHPLSLISRDYTYKVVNQAYCDARKKNGYKYTSIVEIEGKTAIDLFGEEIFKDKIKKRIDDCLGGEGFSYEAKFAFGSMENKEDMWYRVDYYPYTVNDLIMGAIVATVDIDKLIKTQYASLLAMAKVAEARDKEDVEPHLRNISLLIEKLIELMIENKIIKEDDDAEFINQIVTASALHDVGKSGIPDNILLKPGKFEPDEWKIMQSHAEQGGKMISDIAKISGEDFLPSSVFAMAEDIATNHHQRYDGKGYPAVVEITQIENGQQSTKVTKREQKLQKVKRQKQDLEIDNGGTGGEKISNIQYSIKKQRDEQIEKIDEEIKSFLEYRDGKVYRPQRGIEISLPARIMTLIDSFEAMLAKRVYKDPYPAEKVYGIIESELGKQFDPIIGKIILDNFDEFVGILGKK